MRTSIPPIVRAPAYILERLNMEKSEAIEAVGLVISVALLLVMLSLTSQMLG